MDIALFILTVLCCGLIIVGLINPTKVFLGPEAKRLKVWKVYGSALFVSFVAFIAAIPNKETRKDAGQDDLKLAQVAPAQSGVRRGSAGSVSPKIKPEMLVSFPKGNMACLSLASLQEVFLQGVKGEATKMNSHFIENGGPNADCLMLPPHEKYKVISVESNVPSQPDWLILELVGKNIKSADSGVFAIVLSDDMVKIESL